MSAEDYEIYGVLKKERQLDAAGRRVQATKDFITARDNASQFGLALERHSEDHYSLSEPGGFRINIYPGNQRLYHDRNRPKAPFLRLDMERDWTLVDVIDAVIVQVD